MNNKTQNKRLSQEEKAKLESFKKWLIDKNYSPKNEEEVKKYYAQYQKEKAQASAQQTKEAAHGTKLNYFRSLKNQCPEGEELYYFKKGGSVGCGCKKKEDGGQVNTAKEGSAVAKFKAARKMSEGAPFRHETSKRKEGWDNKGNYIVTKAGIEERKKQLEANKNKEGEADPNKKPIPQKPKSQPQPKQPTKKECGGAVAKFKMHRQGGNLNHIPFMQKGTPKKGISYKPDWYKSIQALHGVFDKNGDYYEMKTKRSLNGDTFTRRINTHYSQSPLVSDTTYEYFPKQGNSKIMSTKWLFDSNKKDYEKLKSMFNKIVSIPVEKSPIDLM